MFNTLGPLLATVNRVGWAEGIGDLSTIRSEAAILGLIEVPNRRGEGAVTTLQPRTTTDAHPKSLSARFGLGPQPLHTDGAHLTEPPHIVVMTSGRTSTTSTHLWPARHTVKHVRYPPPEVQHGMFLVANGKDSFFTTAFSANTYRYDPGCMTPCDARARSAMQYFNSALEGDQSSEYTNPFEFKWDVPNKILILDNKKMLHARASAENDPARTLQRVSFHVRQVEA
jgi:alpha-ketoglutarate-dependent taurine dioxygenase